MFWDEVEISLHAGRGGNGCVSFRREKYVPRGGPDGGNGGQGGDIILIADPAENTLLAFAREKVFHAPDGKPGRGKNQFGADGKDIVLKVPIGTLIKDSEHGNILKDLSEPGQQITIVRGGQGGRGNKAFATAVRQAPRFAEEGKEGESRRVKLELKLVADVGLIGLPNAGKSTLLSRVTAARPKVAAYPFTTIVPELGVVSLEEGKGFVMVDIPGLIEGAHQGQGLGDAFLRHVERTRLLLHLVDCSSAALQEPLDAYQTIEHELREYAADLLHKPRIVVATKLDDPAAAQHAEQLSKQIGLPVHCISAVSGAGIKELLTLIAEQL